MKRALMRKKCSGSPSSPPKKRARPLKRFPTRPAFCRPPQRALSVECMTAGAAFVEQLREDRRDCARCHFQGYRADRSGPRQARRASGTPDPRYRAAEALTNSLSSKFSAYVDQFSAATDQASSEAEVIGASFKASGDSLHGRHAAWSASAPSDMHTVPGFRSAIEIERLARDMRAQSSEMEASMKAHTRGTWRSRRARGELGRNRQQRLQASDRRR